MCCHSSQLIALDLSPLPPLASSLSIVAQLSPIVDNSFCQHYFCFFLAGITCHVPAALATLSRRQTLIASEFHSLSFIPRTPYPLSQPLSHSLKLKFPRNGDETESSRKINLAKATGQRLNA